MMIRLEELQNELSRLNERRQEIQAEMRLLKAEQRNEHRRRIRAILNERGFTLRDAIEERAGIADLREANWFTDSLTPFSEDALVIFSRDLKKTTSLEGAKDKLESRCYFVMAIYPGSDSWVCAYDLKKIRGFKK